jgi:hypothetical protein
MVMSMRRGMSALILALVFAMTLVFVRSAAAAPYPPVTTAALSVSTTTPCEGQSIQAGGADFGASEAVTLAVGGQAIATAAANASGAFDKTVTTPDLIGRQTLTGTGQISGHHASLSLNIRECGGAGVAGASIGGSGLAFTGVQIAGLALGAAILIGVGAFFVAAGRRRRTSVHA